MEIRIVRIIFIFLTVGSKFIFALDNSLDDEKLDPPFEAAFQGRCGHGSPCDQLCYELHDGMFECDCKDGFVLHRNGYSCLEMNTTAEPLLLKKQDEGEEEGEEEEEDILYQKDASISAELETETPQERQDSTTQSPNLEQKLPVHSTTPAYTESFRATEAVPCPLDCGVGGVCTVAENVPRCRCTLGRGGSSCEEDVTIRSPRFTGQSWLAFPALQAAYKHVQLEMEFRPEAWDGILFLTGERDDMTGDFMALLLHRGFLEFRFDCGSGVGVVRSEETVSLNEWNHLILYRHRWEAWVQLNKGKHVLGRSKSQSMKVEQWFPGLKDVVYMDRNFFSDVAQTLSATTPPLRIPATVTGETFGFNPFRPRPLSPETIVQPPYGVSFVKSFNFKGLFSRITFREPVFVGGPGNTTGLSDKLPIDFGLKGCVRHIDINDHAYSFELAPDGDAVNGFDVVDCTSDRCSKVPCQHSGKCLMTGEEASCLCPLGFTGDLCETRVDLRVPSFNGSSYLRYPGLGSSVLSWLDVQITLKPSAENGVILYNGHRTDGVGDFMAIYICEGHMEFTFDLGTGAATIRTEEPVVLGEWNEVRLSRTGRLAILQVGSQSPVHALAPGAFTQLSLPQNLYIGGVPNFEMVSPKVRVRSSFVGCIQKVTINDKPLQILAEALAGVNVANCPHPCVAQPCGSGRCLPYMDDFMCECAEGFADRACTSKDDENREEIPQFNGDSFLHFSDTNTMKRLLSNHMNLTLRFKTATEDGLLLWSGNRDRPSDFLALGLAHGELYYRFNLGGGEAVIMYNATVLTDDTWHQVFLRRSEQWGELRVDSSPPIARLAPGKLTQLNTNTGLYIGGMENVEVGTSLKYTSGLVGCVSNVVLDEDYSLKLFSMSTTGQNMQQCV